MNVLKKSLPMNYYHVVFKLFINKLTMENAKVFFIIYLFLLQIFDKLMWWMLISWWWTENWTNSNSSMRDIQVKKTRIVIPSRTVVHMHMGRPWGKNLDNPQHLGKFQKDLSTRASELNHVLLFRSMSKILVHCYNFLLST